VRQARPPAGWSRQSGRGIIGLIIAVVVVGFAFTVGRAFYAVKHKFDVMDDFAYEQIKSADVQKHSVDDVKFAIYKQIRELNIPINRVDDIEVTNDSAGWHVHFSWSETVKVPGYEKEFRYIVDKNWKRF
jgi:hypothetical protein